MLRMMAKSFVWTCILIAVIVWGTRFAHAREAELTVRAVDDSWVIVYSCENFTTDDTHIVCDCGEVRLRWNDLDDILEDGFDERGEWTYMFHSIQGEIVYREGCWLNWMTPNAASLSCR